MNLNLNFDIDTESLLLEPIHNFPAFSTAKQSVKLLLNDNESLMSEMSSLSSVEPRQFDICTPLKAGETHKDKAKARLADFGLSVSRLRTKRVALADATEMLRQQVREFLAVPLVSRSAVANLSY